jgi:uncharacterized protein (TIGR00297 family)
MPRGPLLRTPQSAEQRSSSNAPEKVIWRKAIPESRDHIQSQTLVWALAPILAVLTLQAWSFALDQGRGVHLLFAETLGLSIAFAVAVRALRAATSAAAVAGGAICLLVTFYTASASHGPLRSGLAPLIELFLLTFAATRAGRVRKQRAGLAESRSGRGASQVLANLGAAGLVSSSAGAWLVQTSSHVSGRFLFVPYAVPILLLAVLAEATADTVSSEIGQAFGGPPILLTNLRQVAPGTDGAISLFGTFAGLVSAALIAAVGAWAFRLSVRAILIAFLSGAAGLFFDSLLGATVEKKGWLGNDLVNFSSTVFSALVALALLLITSAAFPA